ncbi:hypothetical protein GCM10028821_20510 [Hymenobacter jeollabukensis]
MRRLPERWSPDPGAAGRGRDDGAWARNNRDRGRNDRNRLRNGRDQGRMPEERTRKEQDGRRNS